MFHITVGSTAYCDQPTADHSELVIQFSNLPELLWETKEAEAEVH